MFMSYYFAGHRYRPFHDFGYVALNVLSVVPEDTGTYTCRAVNMIGTAEIQATLTVTGKRKIHNEIKILIFNFFNYLFKTDKHISCNCFVIMTSMHVKYNKN